MNTADHRSPDAIEADIADTRKNIDVTLTALESRLNSRELIDQAIEYARQSGAREFVSNLQGSVKHNPLPVSLVGIGLAWLMIADRSDRRPVSTESIDTQESGGLSERVQQVRASAASARQKISDTTHAAREKAAHMSESAREQWDRARGGYDRLVNEQPLALGAIGLAFGALFAALMPRTRQEDELLGGARDRLADKAREVGERQVEKVQRVATAAGSAAAEQARREDLVGADSGRLHGSEPSRVAPTS